MEVPALNDMQENGLEALPYWQRMFPRAATMQAPLAFTGSALSIAHFLAGATCHNSRGTPGTRADSARCAGNEKLYAPSGLIVENGDARVSYLVGGILMGAVIPYTVKVMMPLNRQLLLKAWHDACHSCIQLWRLTCAAQDANNQPREWKTTKMRLWGHLHHARTAASVAAAGLILYNIFGPDRVRD